MNTKIQATENLNSWGRISRMAIGIVMLTPVFLVSGHLNALALLALFAVVPIICAIDGYCPLVSWYRACKNSQNVRLSNKQRGEYALLATVLIGSVFVPGDNASAWLILPLLGIYPAVIAIFGEKLITAVISSSNVTPEQSVARQKPASIFALKQSASAALQHGDIHHAA